VISLILVAYSLAYPALVIWSGHQVPRAPLFAVPCPTTLFTAGVLLTAGRLPIAILIVPTLWALLGGTAAIALGVKPDFMLFGAALCLMGYGAWALKARKGIPQQPLRERPPAG
jgi:hypothetical protein